MSGSGDRSVRNVWPVLFVLGIVMLNRPFINIFDQPEEILGIPLLFHYMIFGWLFSIGVIVFYRKALTSRSGKDGG